MNESPSVPGSAGSRPDAEVVRVSWELELLISGALIFSLLQIPGRLDVWWEGARAHVTGVPRFAFFLGYYYLSLSTFTLIAIFCLHIASRAYWVGLIGLRSVYPEGPDLDRLKGRGPIFRRMIRVRLPTLEEATGSADHFCSLIFSFAFLLLIMLAVSLLLFGGAAAGGALLQATLFPDADVPTLVVVLGALVLVPIALAELLDRTFQDRIAPDSRTDRLIRRVLRFNYYLSGGPLMQPSS